MQALRIDDHSLAGWSSYAQKFGFVPAPMILRAGEIFLNGASGSKKLERADAQVWHALQENIGGLIDFFDMLVTRDTIPLINYDDTFDMMKVVAPLSEMMPDRMCRVVVGWNAYNAVKKGALLNLGELDLADLEHFAGVAKELDALRYEWEPALGVADGDPVVATIRDRFANIAGMTKTVAQFVLGGFIFSWFAQASATTHYIQPKRARFFLGLTAAREQAGWFSHQDEDAIFAVAADRLRGTKAELGAAAAVPPVLPYLLAQGEPSDVRVLLDRALAFRKSDEGGRYRKAVDDIRADGVKARRAEDLLKQERDKALAFLAPYSKLDAERSRSLEIKLSAETVGLPVKVSGQTTAKIGVPNWLRVWWNDYVPFGGMSKTLRRMWMAAESYQDLSGKLRSVWAKS
jgi:hypothetical protein